ncbi:MAG: LytTR family DNA-binding domain-containing protein [Lachnospiraceae bacterium]|nr:LytTR family DNA-binding domain-containing protein [Lachnospiraceae bacterium]
MIIRLEVDENLTETEVVIRTKEMNEEVFHLQQMLAGANAGKKQFVFYKGETEYYISLEDILFLETTGSGVCAHTTEEVYQTKYKLYELEELLPSYFVRVSKSTILNSRRIFSITRNLTAASEVSFSGTYKKVYVSRNYYKVLMNKLEEERTQR